MKRVKNLNNLRLVKQVTLIGLVFLLLIPITHVPSGNAQINQIGNLDPWADAVDEALQLLSENAGFIKHLRDYESKAEEVDQYLAQVERARPALDLIDDLKQTDLLIGNAWDLIGDALDASYPGSSEAISYIDQGLRDILRFRGELSKLSALSPMALAADQFNTSPTKANLIAFRDACGPAIEALKEVDDAVQEQGAAVSDLYESVRLTQQALEGIGGLIGIGGEINQLNRAVSGIVQPLSNIDGALDNIHDQAQDDLAVMYEIQDIVARAENPPAVSRPGNTSVTTRTSSAATSELPFGGIAIGIAVIVGAAVLVISLSNRSRRQIAQDTGALGNIEKIIEAQATLMVKSGPQQGTTYPLHDGDLIGRGSDCEIRILDRSISRVHARIRKAQDNWFIQDQGGASGILINDNPVSASRLRDGDVIVLGNSVLVFSLKDGQQERL